jgi:hypothetical protein
METNKQILIDFFENFKESIEYDDFYSISFSKYTINLQGQFTTSLAQRLTQIGFNFTFNEHLNGVCTSDKELTLIRICLT